MMNNLPLDILELIADHLGYFYHDDGFQGRVQLGLAPYSTISAAWNRVVEARTFSAIRLRALRDKRQAFDHNFSRQHRRDALRWLEVMAYFPTKGWTHADNEINKDEFHIAMVWVMSMLHAWEASPKGNQSRCPLDLRISCRQRLIPDVRKSRVRLGLPKPLIGFWNGRARRYMNWKEEGMTDLPAVNRIESLAIIFDEDQQAIHPAVSFDIAICCPNLRVLDIMCRLPIPRSTKMLLQHHKAMAEGLEAVTEQCPRLRSLSIRNAPYEPSCHSFNSQDLTDPRGVYLVCEALRHLCEAGTLAHLCLEYIPVAPELFRCQDATQQCQGETCPLWPSMESFTITTGLVSPKGLWYLTGNPDAPFFSYRPRRPGNVLIGSLDDDADDDTVTCRTPWLLQEFKDEWDNGRDGGRLWRYRPDAEIFDPLALAMIEATTKRMPLLQKGDLALVSHVYANAPIHGSNWMKYYQFKDPCSTHHDDEFGIIISCAAPGHLLRRAPHPCNCWDKIDEVEQEELDDIAVPTWGAFLTGLKHAEKARVEYNFPEDGRNRCREWVGNKGQLLGLLA